MKKFLLFLFVVLLSCPSFAQMLQISDQELIQSSEGIIRGKVISTEAKWVNNGQYIYTFTKIQVDQVFSGQTKKGEIVTVVAPGGYDPPLR